MFSVLRDFIVFGVIFICDGCNFIGFGVLIDDGFIYSDVFF